MYSAKDIATILAERAEEVARYLLPAGKKAGNEWAIGSVDGEAGQSLKFCLSGSKKGIFCDFATGQSGDALDLWALNRKISLLNAMKEAARWLGINSPLTTPRKISAFAKPKTDWVTVQRDSAVHHYLTHERKLTDAVIEKYQLGEQGRTIIFPYVRNCAFVQVKRLRLDRPNGKKEIRVEANCEPCLFGWQTILDNARAVTLCEGELDALSLYQYGYPALSLPFGGGTGNKHAWLEYEFENLAVFDVIYLCFDQDEVGRATTIELAERLGRHRCRIVNLPCKDANQCLQTGISSQEIKACFDNAATLDPQELKSASCFVNEVIHAFYPPDNKQIGLRTPWTKANNFILLRPNELSLWTGICGHGKSQFLGHVILSCLEQEAKVCIASLEIKPKQLLMRLTRQAAGLANPSDEYIRAIHNWYSEKLWLFDLVGTAKTQRLLEVFRYAYQRYGIAVFIIDSFMKCGIAEDDFNAQKAFIEQLCDFKNEFNCHIHLVAHPRKGNDESACPNKLDIKGTGAISDLADNVFTIWRNKAKEAELQKLASQGTQPSQDLLLQPDCLWACDKQRNGEWEGKLAFWFDKASFQYLENPNYRPKQYVNFSTQPAVNNYSN